MVNTKITPDVLAGFYRVRLHEGLAQEGYTKLLIGELRIDTEGGHTYWFLLFTPAGLKLETQNLARAIRAYNAL